MNNQNQPVAPPQTTLPTSLQHDYQRIASLEERVAILETQAKNLDSKKIVDVVLKELMKRVRLG